MEKALNLPQALALSDLEDDAGTTTAYVLLQTNKIQDAIQVAENQPANEKSVCALGGPRFRCRPNSICPGNLWLPGGFALVGGAAHPAKFYILRRRNAVPALLLDWWTAAGPVISCPRGRQPVPRDAEAKAGSGQRRRGVAQAIKQSPVRGQLAGARVDHLRS